MISKVTENQGFNISLEKTISEKLCESSWPPPAFSRLNKDFKKLYGSYLVATNKEKKCKFSLISDAVRLFLHITQNWGLLIEL